MDPFEEFQLTYIELPPEIDAQERLIYRGYLKEIPTIAGEASSKKELRRQLLERYLAYREQFITEETTEENTTALLSVEQLLKYYDGEVFDGFEREW